MTRFIAPAPIARFPPIERLETDAAPGVPTSLLVDGVSTILALMSLADISMSLWLSLAAMAICVERMVCL